MFLINYIIQKYSTIIMSVANSLFGDVYLIFLDTLFFKMKMSDWGKGKCRMSVALLILKTD